MDNREKTSGVNLVAAFCACVLIIAAVCIFMPVNGEQKIYSDIIRLHVLANSDSQNDQNLKLEVRDYILSDIAALTENCADSNEAAEKITSELKKIEDKAADFVKSKGYDYSISASLSREIYPERIYTGLNGETPEDYIFPSGEYTSLKIAIGKGEGKNWWCVLFPPLGLSGSKIEEELAAAGYNSEQVSILKKDKGVKYEVRFKILEILSAIFE
jgi:stage II sporulation protein R